MLRIRLAAAALAAGLLALTSCGGGSAKRASPAAGDWPAVLADARGQTLNWYMYGGDDSVNSFVTGYVADRLRERGVTLNQIKVSDTADAVNKVLGEKQAGRSSGGAVDAIWLNGENFATGVQAELWSCGWPASLPNARYVDAADPAIANDFGIPVRGCEAAWQRANSALVYDSAQLGAADVASVTALFDWARAHPGHFTYPALPDFTGSMAVRTVLYDDLGGPGPLQGPFDAGKYGPAAAQLWQRLNGIEPALWRGGATYPQSQDDVEKLYADGQIGAFFTYGPGTVASKVRSGQFPPTTREAVPSVGNLANVSSIAIPANAAHRSAALVLADVLQDPQTQLEFYRTESIYPAIALSRLDPAMRQRFADVNPGPSVLTLDELTRHARPELDSAYVAKLEDDWKTNVLQR